MPIVQEFERKPVRVDVDAAPEESSPRSDQRRSDQGQRRRFRDPDPDLDPLWDEWIDYDLRFVSRREGR